MSAKSPVRPVATLYEEDFALWAEETGRLLRQGRFSELDIENLAEEVADMAKRDKREVENRIAVLIQHLLKWEHQAGKRSGSWEATIITQRAELDRVLEQSPSLRRSVPEAVARVYLSAVRSAAKETGLPEKTFPSECPYSPEQILDATFLPSR